MGSKHVAAEPLGLRQAKQSFLVVLKDFPATYRSELETFPLNGYARIPSMPMTRLALHYKDWDEYFRTLSKATRKDLRRKFREAERAAKLEMEVVNDIASLVDEIYPLYLAVHERSPPRRMGERSSGLSVHDWLSPSSTLGRVSP